MLMYLWFLNRLSHPVFKPKENISYFKPQNRTIVSTRHDNNNLGFWETAHIPLLLVNTNTYLSLKAKCWVKGGVGGQFPGNLN